MSQSSTQPQNTQEFIITPAENAACEAVSDALRQYPALNVIDSLDAATVLVKMSDDERTNLARKHPELVIEPNLLYELY